MSNIDKLKSAAAKAVDNFDPNMFVETRDVLALLDELEAKDQRIAEQADVIARQEKWIRGIEEAMITATDRAEAAEKRIAELEAREINLPPYSFFDFKLGSPFKSGAYCHIDSVNKELSKYGIKMIAAAGKGE
ncbi:hypothetical protein Mulvp2_37 [Enterobacter phage Mulvp2]|nr:hypothetical protein Mulvp2_37 [Enterobacter phage Mulvp2]